jgi:hypothetical protein
MDTLVDMGSFNIQTINKKGIFKELVNLKAAGEIFL